MKCRFLKTCDLTRCPSIFWACSAHRILQFEAGYRDRTTKAIFFTHIYTCLCNVFRSLEHVQCPVDQRTISRVNEPCCQLIKKLQTYRRNKYRNASQDIQLPFVDKSSINQRCQHFQAAVPWFVTRKKQEPHIIQPGIELTNSHECLLFLICSMWLGRRLFTLVIYRLNYLVRAFALLFVMSRATAICYKTLAFLTDC